MAVRVTPKTASQAGEYAAREGARQTQNQNRRKALSDAANSKKWDLDEEFMKNVGKEGLRSQQKEMGEKGWDEQAIDSYRRTPRAPQGKIFSESSLRATRKRMGRKK